MHPMNYENSDFIVPPSFVPWWKSVPIKKWGHAKEIKISPKRYKKDKHYFLKAELEGICTSQLSKSFFSQKFVIPKEMHPGVKKK